jgi:hypothetical protein
MEGVVGMQEVQGLQPLCLKSAAAIAAAGGHALQRCCTRCA